MDQLPPSETGVTSELWNLWNVEKMNELIQTSDLSFVLDLRANVNVNVQNGTHLSLVYLRHIYSVFIYA